MKDVSARESDSGGFEACLAEPAVDWTLRTVRVVLVSVIGRWGRVGGSLRKGKDRGVGLRYFSLLVTGRLA